ncbi:MAG: TetR/AcrR family transcriptional regulator [Acidimicrobiia bacterium]
MAPPKRISRESVLAKAASAFAEGNTPSMDEIAAAAGVSRAALYELFGSRAAILEALGVEHPPSWQDRILMAGAELLAEQGLSGLSLDDVAARSGASRATVYRLFPGKAALFGEIVRTHLAVDESLEMLETMADRPPSEVMPALASSLARAGSVRIGVLRSALFEVTGREDGSEEVVDEVLQNTRVMLRYLEAQMDAGRLRRMHPLLAMQSFVAPLMLHMVSRPILAEELDLDVPLDEVAREFTDTWLRAMAPPRRRPRQTTGTETPPRARSRRP